MLAINTLRRENIFGHGESVLINVANPAVFYRTLVELERIPTPGISEISVPNSSIKVKAKKDASSGTISLSVKAVVGFAVSEEMAKKYARARQSHLENHGREPKQPLPVAGERKEVTGEILLERLYLDADVYRLTLQRSGAGRQVSIEEFARVLDELNNKLFPIYGNIGSSNFYGV